MDTLNIVLVLGTNRSGRKSALAAQYIQEKMQERSDINVQFVDVAEYQFPQDDYGQDIKNQFPEWKQAAETADAFIFVIPEYNHGYPGVLKTFLDILYPEYNHKAVGLAGVSAGKFGGARVLENIVPVLRTLGLTPSSIDINFASVNDLFDENGVITDKDFGEKTTRFLDELVWLARALKHARESEA